MLPPIMVLAITDPDERDFMISLYNEYHHIMFAVAYNILHNKERTEDVVSATLVKMIDKISILMDINGDTRRSYIVSAVKNTAINLAEKIAKEQKRSFFFDGETEDGVKASDNVEYTVLRQETARRVADAIECLRPRDREILRMKYFDEMSDAEIAEVIGTKASTVRMCLTRARNRLLRICEKVGIGL